MISKELNIIKKNYGEQFMHFCRSFFPTILEQEGQLTSILSSHFAPTKHLFEELQNQNKFDEFKRYIYTLFGYQKKQSDLKLVSKSPEQLMDEAGYILYPECKTENDIQRFSSYYDPRELICTFLGGRLEICRVWFAVKKNVEDIKRENFKSPMREDEYGTSVISIQFSRGDNFLSIKNRYNHAVLNPDCTFENDLDNIIEGLTKSFEIFYNTSQNIKAVGSFSLDNFKCADDGRFYHVTCYNNGVCYCAENCCVIVNNRLVSFNKDKYIVADNYIFCLETKSFFSLNKNGLKKQDAFLKSIGYTISNIKSTKLENGQKELTFSGYGLKDTIVTLDKNNSIIKYKNENVIYIEDEFLVNNNTLTEIDLPNVKNIGSYFLKNNDSLETISLPEVKHVETMFMVANKHLKHVNLPKVEKILHGFLASNLDIESIELPSLTFVMDGFMVENRKLTKFVAPNLQTLGCSALFNNNALTSLDLPNLEVMEDDCFFNNTVIDSVNLPKVESIGDDVFANNTELQTLNLPSVKTIGMKFLAKNQSLNQFSAPNLKTVGNGTLEVNRKMRYQLKKIVAQDELEK